MKVILQKTVRDLGKLGDVCTVPDGYAMNFLLPQKLAVVATDAMVASLEQQKKTQQQNKQDAEKLLQELHKKIANKVIVIHRNVDSHGKLYQGISAHDIVFEMRKQHNLIISEKLLEHYKPIKTTGDTEVFVQSPGQKTKIIISVTS